jgi:hypothetical protein
MSTAEKRKKTQPSRTLADRWSPRLAKPWSGVPQYFLRNYHRLRPANQKPFSSVEAMLVVQIMDHKWTTEHPFPRVKKIAGYMGISDRQVRAYLKKFQEDGLLVRVERKSDGRQMSNCYDFSGLFRQLERLMDEDEKLKNSLVEAANEDAESDEDDEGDDD